MTPQEEIAVLRNAIKTVREQRNHARDLIEILMARLARVERENLKLRQENAVLKKSIAEGISAD